MAMVTAQVPRFDPVLLTREDVEDLATFFELDPDACLARLRAYSPVELAERWRAANPQTPDEILSFYREADLYIWELMQWHASMAREWARNTLRHIVERYPPTSGFGRVLEFGCGIGSDSLCLAGRGYRVTMMDVAGPALRFAEHRFRRRGVQAAFRESAGSLPEIPETYDIIICFEVFEHLPDPFGAARALVKSLRPGGLLVQSACFEDDGTYPCHLHRNVQRFEGNRWHIHLAGLGMRHRADRIYERAQGLPRIAQFARYGFWRATGLWIPASYWMRSSRNGASA